MRGAIYRGRLMTRPALHNNWRERQRRRATVQAWRTEHGDWCPGWQTPPHDVQPPHILTADHLYPVGVGGAEDGPLTVLCNSCNSRKRDGRRTQPRAKQIRSREW